MFDFSNRVVMVTGGSGNLGKAVIDAFYAAGASIVTLDRATDRLQSLFPEIANTHNHYLAGGVDVTNIEDVETTVKTALTKLGKIDVLVNTVGGYRAGNPPHETSLDTWDFMMNLNARSLFITCNAVIPTMLENGYGRIINTAAKSGLSASANESAYSVSKSAVLRLTESMAAAYKGAGLTVNAILPGTIDTPQNREAMPNADFSRWVTSEAIAQVVLFLASDAANIINGAFIPLYGAS